MAHYALLDSNNVVTKVITGVHETELIEGLDTETWYGNYCGQVCKRTSYNATNGFRKQFAGIGYTYDSNADVFIAPQPFASWTLDSNHDWQPPIPQPSPPPYTVWDEQLQEWIPYELT